MEIFTDETRTHLDWHSEAGYFKDGKQFALKKNFWRAVQIFASTFPCSEI